MKIGLVLSSTPAYSETFFNAKIKGLQESGFEVVLFVQYTSPSFKLCPVYKSPKVFKNPILQFFSMLFVLLKLVPKLKTIIKFSNLERQQKTTGFELIKKIYLTAHILSQKVDWLHFGFATQALGKELVAKAIGAKMAVSFRGFDINVYPLKHPNCYGLLWKHVAKVHTISSFLLEKSYQLGLDRKVPFEIITPAVDFEKIKLLKESLAPNKLQIITIARLHWIKGLGLAIEAMKLLKVNGLDFEYHIIGDGSKGDLERYKYQVYELGLQNQIIFEGELTHDKTFDLLQKCSIYIQPSVNEGFCNALLEAQSLGKLCIATNVGGIPENIVNNKTGWLLNNFEATTLASKILEVINLTLEEKEIISFNAMARVKKEFNLEKQNEQFKNFYK